MASEVSFSVFSDDSARGGVAVSGRRGGAQKTRRRENAHVGVRVGVRGEMERANIAVVRVEVPSEGVEQVSESEETGTTTPQKRFRDKKNKK